MFGFSKNIFFNYIIFHKALQKRYKAMKFELPFESLASSCSTNKQIKKILLENFHISRLVSEISLPLYRLIKNNILLIYRICWLQPNSYIIKTTNSTIFQFFFISPWWGRIDYCCRASSSIHRRRNLVSPKTIKI